jgi:hypothetical protein
MRQLVHKVIGIVFWILLVGTGRPSGSRWTREAVALA